MVRKGTRAGMLLAVALVFAVAAPARAGQSPTIPRLRDAMAARGLQPQVDAWVLAGDMERPAPGGCYVLSAGICGFNDLIYAGTWERWNPRRAAFEADGLGSSMRLDVTLDADNAQNQWRYSVVITGIRDLATEGEWIVSSAPVVPVPDGWADDAAGDSGTDSAAPTAQDVGTVELKLDVRLPEQGQTPADGAFFAVLSGHDLPEKPVPVPNTGRAFKLPTLVFDAGDVGQHAYTVRAHVQQAEDGWVYDTASYTVTVTVLRDDAGRLQATAAYPDHAEAVVLRHAFQPTLPEGQDVPMPEEDAEPAP